MKKLTKLIAGVALGLGILGAVKWYQVANNYATIDFALSNHNISVKDKSYKKIPRVEKGERFIVLFECKSTKGLESVALYENGNMVEEQKINGWKGHYQETFQTQKTPGSKTYALVAKDLKGTTRTASRTIEVTDIDYKGPELFTIGVGYSFGKP